jgi:HD superfamily phosphohydrolase
VDTKTKRIRTLLYGDERLSAGEVDLLHTPALQRLYDLHQLGLTDRIYIDASHSRLHHVVGVLQQTEKLVDAIVQNLGTNADRVFIATGYKVRAGDFKKCVEAKKPVIRLIGLLHDLTHAPYGHTIEDEIHLVACKHDEPGRQSEAFYQLVCQYLGWLALEAGVRPATLNGTTATEHQTLHIPPELWRYLQVPSSAPPRDIAEIARMAGSLLKNPSPGALAAWQRSRGGEEIAELLAQLSCAMRALLYLDVLHADRISDANCPKEEQYAFEQLIAETLANAGMTQFLGRYTFEKQRDAYMLDVIGNTVCADLLDYAQRDAHFAGMKLGYDAERIAENFTLVTLDLGITGRGLADDEATTHSTRKLIDPFKGKSLRTAISLYSHKLRMDVVGELMNLLNVRYYLYERALFHPTKCAAGAMLGTAIQLIGWRPLRPGEKVDAYELPDDFRNVGDAVFLHDLAGGAQIALSVLTAEPAKVLVHVEDCKKQLNNFPCSQLRVAELILDRWNQLPRSEALENVQAGLELLSRVTARRFYKAVFRNLPNSKNPILRKIPEDLAETFKNPITRFDAERKIEVAAGLRRGSIVIHCPRWTTAQKVANVLLVFPTKDGKGELPCKLRNIRELDPDVFDAHEEAILAVERMYESMWRLVVYVTPEALAQYPMVTERAGKVVFDTMDEDQSYPEEKGWENDKHLAAELDQKFGELALSAIAPVPESRGARTETETGTVGGPEQSTEGPEGGTKTPVHAARRQNWVMTVRRSWRTDVSKDTPRLVEFYDDELSNLPDESFEQLLRGVEGRFTTAPKERRPSKLDNFLRTVIEMRDGKSGPLFAEGS